MAGRPGTKADNERLRARVNELQGEVSRLRQLLASVDPESLEGDGSRPAPVEKYSPEVDKRVLAMAAEGVTEPGWVSWLGLDGETWTEWKAQHPSLMAAVRKARARLAAFWDAKAVEAIETGNTKFPVGVFQQLKKSWVEEQDGASREDASKFVLVDLRESLPEDGEAA